MSKKTYTQLSESERQAIALGREQKLSLSAIARALGRHKSTISRECTRNAGGNGYNVKYAHQRSIRRKRFARPSPNCTAMARCIPSSVPTCARSGRLSKSPKISNVYIPTTNACKPLTRASTPAFTPNHVGH